MCIRDRLSTDRIGGLKLIERAAEASQVVVDSPASSKSSLVQQKSLFLAAKTNEALGNFEVSEKYYSEIIESAPDSALADSAKRGVVRSTSKDYAAIYDQFRNFEELAEEAPGALVPESPDVKFDVDIGDAPPIVMPKKEEENVEPADKEKAFTPGVTKEMEPGETREMETPKAEDPKTEVEKMEPKTDPEIPAPATTEAPETKPETVEPVKPEMEEPPVKIDPIPPVEETVPPAKPPETPGG